MWWCIKVIMIIMVIMITIIAPQGFGPEAKTRGGIIENPAY